MNIYLSHSTGFSTTEAQNLLNAASQKAPGKRWLNRQPGYGCYISKRGVIIWDTEVCWILRPAEWRDWKRNPTHTGSAYDAFKLRQIDLTFIPHPEWNTTIPAKVSTNHLNQCQLYWARRAHEEALRVARNERRREAYAAAKNT
jgi:hypothetical protein